MPEFYELCLRKTSEEIRQKAEELGWTATNCDYNTVFLEADNWGELKRQIKEERESADVLVFEAGDSELNRKASEDSRLDVILSPEEGNKDSGIDYVTAENASENNIAVGFSLKTLQKKGKRRSQILASWRKNLRLCEKFDTPYIITTEASSVHELRAPRDLASIIESLGFKGREPVSQNPSKILERADRVNSEGYIRPGVREK